MTEQQRPDDDVEGHIRMGAQGDVEEDVEGHGPRTPRLDAEGSEDDVEGHGPRTPRLDAEGSEDDVEGHHSFWKVDDQGDDDVEGHSIQRPR